MYAIVDIETTGGFAYKNSITEIAIFIHNGEKVVNELITLINPDKKVPTFITSLTGIDNDMLESAPLFKDVAEEIFELLKDKIFIAHNVGFDYSFLKKEFKYSGYNFSSKKLCTVRLSKNIFPGLPSYGLGSLCGSLGITINDRHRAGGDARATVKLFEYLLENDKEDYIGYSLNRLSQESSLPPNLDRKDYDNLPEETGVYYFINGKGEVIYIGKAKNIKSRINAHFRDFDKSRRKSDFRNQIHNIGYELCGNELIALLKESHEIKQHWPIFNRAQRKSDNCWGIYEYFDNSGFQRLVVNRITADNPALISFKSHNEAWTYLNEKIEGYKLCPKLCNTQRSKKQCFEYDKGNCLGACIQLENQENYNQRVQECIDSIKLFNNSFFIMGHGRTEEEKSIIMVEKGVYKGFGYFDRNGQDNNLEDLRNNIKPYPDNQDIQRILNSHLLTRNPKVIRF
ncbi:MAG TPA: exonuclease domain-containing protein [Cyclobacteriaceae bacterium]